jgi:hypothetical protein
VVNTSTPKSAAARTPNLFVVLMIVSYSVLTAFHDM